MPAGATSGSRKRAWTFEAKTHAHTNRNPGAYLHGAHVPRLGIF